MVFSIRPIVERSGAGWRIKIPTRRMRTPPPDRKGKIRVEIGGPAGLIGRETSYHVDRHTFKFRIPREIARLIEIKTGEERPTLIIDIERNNGSGMRAFIRNVELNYYPVRSVGGYKQGYKYCSKCQHYVLIDGTRCPYCNTILRTRSRHRSSSG